MQSVFNINGMDKPVIILPPGMKFSDLCLLLDFMYTGQAQVPHERLEFFLKMGEVLQVRGIKDGPFQYMPNLAYQTVQHQQTTRTTTFNNNRSLDRSLDPTISSTQMSPTEPTAKRSREEEDIVQEASEFFLNLIDGNSDIDVDISQVKALKTNQTSLIHNRMSSVSRSGVITQEPVGMKPNILKPAVPVKQKPTFLCRFCGRSMVAKARMDKHEIECDDNPNRQIVKCEICSLEVKPSSMGNHKKSHHGVTKVPAKKKPVPPSPPKNVIAARSQVTPATDINSGLPMSPGFNSLQLQNISNLSALLNASGSSLNNSYNVTQDPAVAEEAPKLEPTAIKDKAFQEKDPLTLSDS